MDNYLGEQTGAVRNTAGLSEVSVQSHSALSAHSAKRESVGFDISFDQYISAECAVINIPASMEQAAGHNQRVAEHWTSCGFPVLPVRGGDRQVLRKQEDGSKHPDMMRAKTPFKTFIDRNTGESCAIRNTCDVGNEWASVARGENTAGAAVMLDMRGQNFKHNEQGVPIYCGIELIDAEDGELFYPMVLDLDAIGHGATSVEERAILTQNVAAAVVNGGPKWWYDKCAEYNIDPSTYFVVQTPSGGLHVWMRVPKRLIGLIKNWSGDACLAEHVDIRVAPGLLIAPGTIIDPRPNEPVRAYRVVAGHSSLSTTAEPPAFVVEAIDAKIRACREAETRRYVERPEKLAASLPFLAESERRYCETVLSNAFQDAPAPLQGRSNWLFETFYKLSWLISDGYLHESDLREIGYDLCRQIFTDKDPSSEYRNVDRGLDYGLPKVAAPENSPRRRRAEDAVLGALLTMPPDEDWPNSSANGAVKGRDLAAASEERGGAGSADASANVSGQLSSARANWRISKFGIDLDLVPEMEFQEARFPEGLEPFPELLNPPGLLGDIVRYAELSEAYQQPTIRTAVALHVVGSIISGVVDGEKVGAYFTSPALAFVAVAGSATGKGMGTAVCAELLESADRAQMVANASFPRTGQALAAIFKRTPITAFVSDEIGHVFHNISSSRANENVVLLSKYVLTATNGGVFRAEEAMSNKAAEPVRVWLNVIGFTTPDAAKHLYNSSMINKGDANRFLAIIGHEHANPSVIAKILTPSQIEAEKSGIRDLVTTFARDIEKCALERLYHDEDA